MYFTRTTSFCFWLILLVIVGVYLLLLLVVDVQESKTNIVVELLFSWSVGRLE